MTLELDELGVVTRKDSCPREDVLSPGPAALSAWDGEGTVWPIRVRTFLQRRLGHTENEMSVSAKGRGGTWPWAMAKQPRLRLDGSSHSESLNGKCKYSVLSDNPAVLAVDPFLGWRLIIRVKTPFSEPLLNSGLSQWSAKLSTGRCSSL